MVLMLNIATCYYQANILVVVVMLFSTNTTIFMPKKQKMQNLVIDRGSVEDRALVAAWRYWSVVGGDRAVVAAQKLDIIQDSDYQIICS